MFPKRELYLPNQARFRNETRLITARAVPEAEEMLFPSD